MSIAVDITIIGEGVVGLAIAAELSRQGRSVFVFDRELMLDRRRGAC
ncbi:MAG: FAD-dependent oxidoreductase [Dehalococcoidia bacterium]